MGAVGSLVTLWAAVNGVHMLDIILTGACAMARLAGASCAPDLGGEVSGVYVGAASKVYTCSLCYRSRACTRWLSSRMGCSFCAPRQALQNCCKVVGVLNCVNTLI